MILRPDWKQWQKWSKLTGSAVGGTSGHSNSHKRWKASQRERRPFVGQAHWRHLADGPRGNSSGEDKGQTRRGRQHRFRPFEFIARSRARVFEATHSKRVHASGVSHVTQRTRVSFLESRRYKIKRIEVHYVSKCSLYTFLWQSRPGYQIHAISLLYW